MSKSNSGAALQRLYHLWGIESLLKIDCGARGKFRTGVGAASARIWLWMPYPAVDPSKGLERLVDLPQGRMEKAEEVNCEAVFWICPVHRATLL